MYILAWEYYRHFVGFKSGFAKVGRFEARCFGVFHFSSTTMQPTRRNILSALAVTVHQILNQSLQWQKRENDIQWLFVSEFSTDVQGC